MIEKEFYILTPDGFSLKTIVCFPKKIEKIVVMCHGISSHKQEYLDMFSVLAQKISRNNIASIRFDFRGHGESSGKSIDFSVITQMIDLESIIRWIGLQPEHWNGIPMSYVGVSFGGAPGILYQSLYSSFERICLFAPVLSYRKTFVEPTTEWGVQNFNKSAWEKAKVDGFLVLDGEFHMSLKLLNELLIIDPVFILNGLDIPVQIFHGTRDALVPYSVAEEIAKNNPIIDVRLIKGMGHGLYISGDDDGVTKESKMLQDDYYKVTSEFLS